MFPNLVRNWLDRVLAWVDCPAPCALGWIPSVFTPVFYGYRDHELVLPPQQVATQTLTAGPITTTGVPGSIEVRCRVFYPTLDGAPADAPPLTGCAQTPLIVFSHGQCGSPPFPDLQVAWYELASTVARAGYVVVVPKYVDPGSDEAAEQLVRTVTWARSAESPYAKMVKPAPQTGLVATHTARKPPSG